MTAKRMISGEVLKYRNGFFIPGGYGMPHPGSSRFSLTKPLGGLLAQELCGSAERWARDEVTIGKALYNRIMGYCD
jgi:hypothetical protein